MSYEIIYDKQFIKTTKGFVPMVLSGSNNCYDVGNSNKMRRSRGWMRWNIGKMICTEKELLDFTNTLRQILIDHNNSYLKQYPDWDVYDDKCFGYFSSISVGGGGTRKTTFGNFQGVFKMGVKNSLTIEELIENGISIKLFTSNYDVESNRLKGFEPINFYPKTTSEFEEFVEISKDYPINIYITYCGADEYTIKRLKQKRSFKEPKIVEIKEAYVIQLHNGSFFHKFTKYGYKYSFHSHKYFYSKLLANKTLKKVNDRIGGDAKINTIVFDSPREIMV